MLLEMNFASAFRI